MDWKRLSFVKQFTLTYVACCCSFGQYVAVRPTPVAPCLSLTDDDDRNVQAPTKHEKTIKQKQISHKCHHASFSLMVSASSTRKHLQTKTENHLLKIGQDINNVVRWRSRFFLKLIFLGYKIYIPTYWVTQQVLDLFFVEILKFARKLWIWIFVKIRQIEKGNLEWM